MAPLPLPSQHVCLLVFVSWSLVSGSPIHRTNDDQTLPRETKSDRATTSRDIYTPVDIRKREETGYNGLDAVSRSEYPCQNDVDCYPKAYENSTIPNYLVHCKDQVCQCQNCFYSLNDSCAMRSCHYFSNSSGKCVSKRKSQFEAFLLSLFLSATGAANLYIGQNTLGKVLATGIWHVYCERLALFI